MADLIRQNILLDFKANTKDANTKAKKIRKETDLINTGLVKMAKLAGGIFAAREIGLFAKRSAELAINFEQTAISFETFLGSAEKAKTVLADLTEFSTATPYEPNQVFKAGKALLAFGIEQKKLIPSLKAIGDTAAATGKDFNELAIIYGKARTQGTLFAEDINQLTEAGVPIIAELAAQFGVAESQVKKLGSEGQITFANLEKAFQDMTGEGGRFFNLMDRQSKSVGGLISTLRGNVSELMRVMGEAMLPVIRNSVNVLNRWAKGLKEAISPTKLASENTKELHTQFNFQINALKRLAPESEGRKRLISQINREYKDYLPNLLDEKSTLEDIEQAQKDANQAFLEKIILLSLEEELKKEAELTRDAFNELAEAEVNVAKASEILAEKQIELNAAGGPAINPDGINTATEALNSFSEAQEAVSTESEQFVKDTGKRQEEITNKWELAAEKIDRSLDQIRERFREVNEGKPGETKGGPLKAMVGSLEDLSKKIKDQEEIIQKSLDGPTIQAAQENIKELTSEFVQLSIIISELEKPFASLGVLDFFASLDIEAELDGILEQANKQRAETNKEFFDDFAEDQLKAWQDGEDAKNAASKAAAEERERIGQQLQDEGIRNTIDGINMVTQARIDAKDREIQLQQERVAEISAIADEGNAEQLQLEEQRLAKLEDERRKAVRQQDATNKAFAIAELARNTAMTTANLLTFISSAAAGSGPLAPVVVPSVLGIIASIMATAGTLFTPPSFARGVEEFKPTGKAQSKDGGYMAYLHPGERVMTAQQNQALSGLSNEEVVQLVRGSEKWTRSNKDERGLKALKGLTSEQMKTRKAIESLGIDFNVDMDGFSGGLKKRIARETIGKKLAG